MIFDKIITAIYNIVIGLLDPLDQLNEFVLDPYIADSIYDFFKFVAYLVPLGRLWPILAIFLSIYTVRIIIALIKTLWDLIPVL